LPARLIDGTATGLAMRAELEGELRALASRGVTPGLAAVLVGDNPASATYVRMKGKACEEAGLHHETVRLPKETTQAELLALVDRLNADSKIHGILVQLPLPKQIDSQKVLGRVAPARMWTASTPRTSARCRSGTPRGFGPPRRSACNSYWCAAGSTRPASMP